MRKLILIWLLFGVAHAATPSFVKSVVILGQTSSPAATTSITPTTAGDSLIVGVFASGSGSFTGATNSASSTVIQDVATAHFELLRVASCASGAQTFSISFTGFTELYSVVIEVTPSVNFDQATTEASGASIHPLTNNLTPANNNEFLVALVKTVSGGITFSSWTNSFTQDRQSVAGPSLADAYFVQTTGPTSINAQVTISTSESWFAELGAYGTAPPPFVAAPVYSGGKPMLSKGAFVN